MCCRTDRARRSASIQPGAVRLFGTGPFQRATVVGGLRAHERPRGLRGGRSANLAGGACTQDTVRITLAPTAAQASPSFKAIPARQSTRGDYDGWPVSHAEPGLLERAGTSQGVRVQL